MLNVRSLNQYYAQSHTLHDTSLQIDKGGCTGIMGRNGVGKCALLQCITVLLPVKDGHIELKGKNVRSFHNSASRRTCASDCQRVAMERRPSLPSC